eukprot:3932507-Rhodomonas_salina.2
MLRSQCCLASVTDSWTLARSRDAAEAGCPDRDDPHCPTLHGEGQCSRFVFPGVGARDCVAEACGGCEVAVTSNLAAMCLP